MVDHSMNAHIASPKPIVKRVWYEGTDALQEGVAVCYNSDYGTAATLTPERSSRVERPSIANNLYFAGVSLRDYPAESGGQFIEIAVPGSRDINIAVGANTVLGTGTLTFQVAGGVDAGRFVYAGFPGSGSARIKQTVAAAVITSDMVGTTWSLAADGITLTHASATVLAGYKVVLLGGVAEDASIYIVRGTYTVASVTDATTCVLSSTAHAATAAGAMDCVGYIYTGNPMCQADLMEGEEAGGCEFVNIIDGGNTAQVPMPGGFTYVPGGITITGDIDMILADGTEFGERKGFGILGALTTSDVTIVPTTTSNKCGGGALTEILTMDDAGDGVTMKWTGAAGWNCTELIGGATEN